MSESKPKSFEISKRGCLGAYRRVKANKGGAGVDGEPPTPFGNPETVPPELVAAMQAQAEEWAPGLTGFFATKQG